MKILIIDDDSTKAGQIANLIREISELTEDDIRFVTSLHEARIQLRSTLYDLIILDLYIPDKLGGTPRAETGIAFIEEICSDISYNIPLDIVALTAYKDAKDVFSSNKELSGFTILEYDPTKTYWKDFLVSRIQYLIQCNQQRRITKRPPECDVLWLTTVAVETDAIKELYTWQSFSLDNDASIYNFSVQMCGNKEVNIIHAQLPEMGIASAAAITAKTISHFDPHYIIMTGIAAGLDNEIMPGDVMIASNVWNYDSGKYVEQTNPDGQPDYHLNADVKTLNVTFDFSEQLKQFSRDEKERIKNRDEEKSFNNKVGVFACGSAVVASEAKVKEDIKAHARKTIAIDMESYGVLFAAKTTKTPEVPAVIIKGKSDKGDSGKDDSVQNLAALNSAIVAQDLITTLFSD